MKRYKVEGPVEASGRPPLGPLPEFVQVEYWTGEGRNKVESGIEVMLRKGHKIDDIRLVVGPQVIMWVKDGAPIQLEDVIYRTIYGDIKVRIDHSLSDGQFYLTTERNVPDEP